MEDPKEVAEHVMLIDLARNDVGRVVSFGTEVVDEVMVVERYSHIMHLTSQVSGTLAPGKGPIDVLRATLPAGTLSGAPKVRAMEIIDDLEPTKRGVYGGVVGYLDFSGNLDTAIAIRTMTVTPDGRASVQAGAGIVADSDPASENAECAHKAAALLSAVAMARAARPGPVMTASPGPAERRRRCRLRDGGPGGGTRRRDGCRDPTPAPTSRASAARTSTAWAWGRAPSRSLLSPQGKVDAYVRVTRTGDESFVLDTDAGCGADLLARLQRFRLRVAVDLEQLDWACLALRGPTASPRRSSAPPGGPVLALAVAWPGWSGVDLLGPTPADDPELDGWLPDGRRAVRPGDVGGRPHRGRRAGGGP